MRMRRTIVTGVATALVGVLVLSGCGDDDEDDGSSGGQSAGGPAIELGLVNTENSPAGSYPGGRQGAEAAVEYINKELGGVNGRPLRLDTCITNGSPETSIECANRFVRENKVAVMPGIDLSAPGGMKIFADAGIPYIGGTFASPEEYTSPVGYSFVGAAAGAVTGMAAYTGQEIKAEKVVILAPDVPQVTSSMDLFVKPVLAKLGVTDVTVVSEAATAADMTPAVTRANDDDPDAILIFFPGPSCGKVMQAIASLNIPREKIVYSQECSNAEALGASNGGADGSVFQSIFPSLDTDEPNVKLYREKMAEYSDGDVGGSTATGFDSVMNLYAILKTLDPGNISRDTLITALKATKDHPGFLSHGFTCDGQQFPGLVALCDANVRFLKYQDGKFAETNNQWFNGAALLAGG